MLLDTNVLVSGLRSKKGAAFKLLSMVGKGDFEICLSVPVVLEYEEVLSAQLEELHLADSDVRDLLDYLCSVGKHQEVYFLWRPYLRDAKDDFILEAAVAGDCDAIITYNRRDFAGAEKFDVQILTPAQFLKRIGALQ
ncbi:MAG TPA: putative toxin-antitoxin system toxin component, PIN family [Candidatus Binatia bacterium]